VTKRNPQAARAEILEKPVTASELLATIRRVLDAKHSHHARARLAILARKPSTG